MCTIIYMYMYVYVCLYTQSPANKGPFVFKIENEINRLVKAVWCFVCLFVCFVSPSTCFLFGLIILLIWKYFVISREIGPCVKTIKIKIEGQKLPLSCYFYIIYFFFFFFHLFSMRKYISSINRLIEVICIRWIITMYSPYWNRNITQSTKHAVWCSQFREAFRTIGW